MVAASKMRVAQVNTMKSRGMVVPFIEMLGDQPGTHAYIKRGNSSERMLVAPLPPKPWGFACTAVDVEKAIVVPVSTDKGLCGGINSTISKYTRGILAALAGGEAYGMFCLE